MSYMAQTDARMKRAEEFYRIIEKHVAGYVGCVIYTEELLKAESQITWPPNYFNQHVIRNPYFSAFHSIIRQLIEYQHEIGIDKPIQLVFDTQTEMNTVLASLDYLILNTPGRFHHLLTEPRFEDDTTTPPLQAADLYAWWARKWAIDRLPARDEQFAWTRTRKIRGILIEIDGHRSHHSRTNGPQRERPDRAAFPGTQPRCPLYPPRADVVSPAGYVRTTT